MTTVGATDIDGFRHEISLAELSWRPSVYVVLLRRNTVLLVPQKERGFDLPGGGVELGESLAEAAAREAREETGLRIDPGPVVAVRESFFVWAPDDPGAREAYQCLMFYLIASVIDGSLNTEGFDERERRDAELARWVPLDDLAALKVASSVDFRPVVMSVADGLR